METTLGVILIWHVVAIMKPELLLTITQKLGGY